MHKEEPRGRTHKEDMQVPADKHKKPVVDSQNFQYKFPYLAACLQHTVQAVLDVL